LGLCGSSSLCRKQVLSRCGNSWKPTKKNGLDNTKEKPQSPNTRDSALPALACSGEFPWAFGPPEAMKIGVVPAKAGTHCWSTMDSRIRGNDAHEAIFRRTVAQSLCLSNSAVLYLKNTRNLLLPGGNVALLNRGKAADSQNQRVCATRSAVPGSCGRCFLRPPHSPMKPMNSWRARSRYSKKFGVSFSDGIRW